MYASILKLLKISLLWAVITKHRKIVRCDGALENETKFFLC